jgi:hypothetical protein
VWDSVAVVREVLRVLVVLQQEVRVPGLKQPPSSQG